MRPGVVHALLLAVPLASPAGAAELELGVDMGTVYNTNLFGSAVNPVSDLSGRFGPRLRAMDEVGAFTWDVRYWPSYEKYLDITEADGWDQDLDASAIWRLSPRTQIHFGERYLDVGNVNEIFTQEHLPDPTVDTGVQFGRDRLKTNNVSLMLDHELAPRHSTTFSVQRADNRFARQVQSESTVTGVSGSYLYTWDPLQRLGLRLSGTQQEVSLGGAKPEPTRYYNLAFQWVRAFDPTLKLDAYAGPTLVQHKQPKLPTTLVVRRFPLIAGIPIHASSCPRNDQGELFLGDSCQPFAVDDLGTLFSDTAPFLESADVGRRGSGPSGSSLTYFANIDLSKEWRNVELTLSYSRDASTTSELSGIVLDTLSAYVRWAPSPKWTFALEGYYQRREQPTAGLAAQPLVEPATVNGVPDVAEATAFRIVTRKRTLQFNDYVGGLYVNYHVNRWMYVYGNCTYQHETLRDELERLVIQNDSWNRFYVSIGVTYTLPPVHLPF